MTADDFRPLLADATSGRELARLWREINDALRECSPEDYDDLFDLRCEVEDAKEAMAR